MSLEVIQIIEDDFDHAVLLDCTLRKARYRTNVARDGKTGLLDVFRLKPALVLLDVMLPDLDGHEVCRRLRSDPRTETIPIIMISALGSLDDHRIVGLDLGADDYLAKPFSAKELVSRVRAVLRRASLRTESTDCAFGGELLLEDSRYVVSFRGQRIELTAPEWQILRRLSAHPGQVLTREELIFLIWGEDGLIHEHELERHVEALRSKLGDHSERPELLVPSATGYVLTASQQ